MPAIRMYEKVDSLLTRNFLIIALQICVPILNADDDQKNICFSKLAIPLLPNRCSYKYFPVVPMHCVACYYNYSRWSCAVPY
jgi:hypothetical protein